MPIPRTIWQTYKTCELPDVGIAAALDWQRFNPDWNYRFMDDDEAAEVVRSFDRELFACFAQAPLGVMRADIWRYVVVYLHGGLYADLDARCNAAIDAWLCDDWRMLVSGESTREFFCQWTFAAEAGYPAFEFVFDLIKSRWRTVDWNSPHFVHHLTGPAVWTDGLLAFLRLRPLDLLECGEVLNASPVAVESGFCFHPNRRLFVDGAVTHLYASQNWQSDHYARWIEQRTDTKHWRT